MKFKVPKALIDEITRREGKKKQISRAQVAEVLRHLFDIVAEGSFNIPSTVMVNGGVIAGTLSRFKGRKK
jgi:hypothetical protein